MTVERFKKLFDYNIWANNRMWDCIMQLSDEQFSRPCDYSVGSLHDQCVHQMSAEELWLSRIRDNISTGQLAQTQDYPTRQAIHKHWQGVNQQWVDYIHSLTEADLDASLAFVSVSYNTTFHNQRWEGLMQVLNHSTDHRAQILSLIYQVGGETIAQDWIFYLWGK